MCRHAGYVGAEISLHRFLTAPPHSLVVQAYRPREMITAALNADGFGVGWVGADGAPGRYTNPMPIWSDSNLVHLGKALASRAWIGNVRSATPGLPINQANTHPFCAGEMLFSHNGFVTDFADSLRPRLRRWLEPAFDSAIEGTTDSEYLFAVIRQIMAAHGADAAAGIAILAGLLRDWVPELPILLNIMIMQGETITASRYAQNHDAPSLYVGQDPESFGAGWLIASEPLTEHPSWQSIAPGSVVTLTQNSEPVVAAL